MSSGNTEIYTNQHYTCKKQKWKFVTEKVLDLQAKSHAHDTVLANSPASLTIHQCHIPKHSFFLCLRHQHEPSVKHLRYNTITNTLIIVQHEKIPWDNWSSWRRQGVGEAYLGHGVIRSGTRVRLSCHEPTHSPMPSATTTCGSELQGLRVHRIIFSWVPDPKNMSCEAIIYSL